MAEGIGLSTDKVSKNCATCLGRHPAPFGTKCRYQGEVDGTTPAMSDLSDNDLGGGSPPRTTKSPLPTREEHLAKLVAKEDEKRKALEENRRVRELEHQLATLRVANKDIERDIDEGNMLADTLGVHRGQQSFKPSRQSTLAGSGLLAPVRDRAARQRGSDGGAGKPGGEGRSINQVPWRPPRGLQSVQQDLATAGVDPGLGLGILPEEYVNMEEINHQSGSEFDRSLLSGLLGLSESSRRKRSNNWMRPDCHIPTDKGHSEMSFPELVYGMTTVIKKMLTNPESVNPRVSLLGYVNHMQFIAYKATTGAFDARALSNYEHKVTGNVLEGSTHDYIAGDEDAMTTHLSAENMIVVQELQQKLKKMQAQGGVSGGGGGSRKQYKYVVPDHICAKYNFNWCDFPNCAKDHVCTFCGGAHKGKTCRQREGGGSTQGRQQWGPQAPPARQQQHYNPYGQQGTGAPPSGY